MEYGQNCSLFRAWSDYCSGNLIPGLGHCVVPGLGPCLGYALGTCIGHGGDSVLGPGLGPGQGPGLYTGLVHFPGPDLGRGQAVSRSGSWYGSVPGFI